MEEKVPTKLSARRERFCLEYVIDCNASKAAIRAGYAKTGAAQQAWRFLDRPDIQERVAELQAKIAEKLEITAVYVLSGVKEVADRCMEAKEVFDKDGNSMGYCQFDANGATRAFELLGKHLKLFTEKTEVDLVMVPLGPREIIMNYIPESAEKPKDMEQQKCLTSGQNLDSLQSKQ